MKIFNTLLLCVILFFAYKFNIYLGLALTAAIIVYGIYHFLPQFYRMKGQRAFADGDFKSAGIWYKKAVATGHAKGDIRMEYSYILLRTGDIDEAEQVVNNMLCYKLKPEYRGRAVIQRCMCYYKKGNLDEALKDGMELYEDGFKSIMLYGMLGFFKILQAPMSEETFEFCKEAYDYADDDRDIRDNLLICCYNRGEYEKAKELADKINEDSPKSIEGWYHAAQVDEKLGNYSEALEKLEKIADCTRSFMTTISEEEIENLKAKLKLHTNGKKQLKEDNK